MPTHETSPIIDVRIMPGALRATVTDAHALDPAAPVGAECMFLGRTRSESNDRHGDLMALEYEAHETMALKILNDLARIAIERFDCRLVRMHHAIGRVAVGEASVFVQVLTAHRDESFVACRFLIDELKKSVPIWKREVWKDGTTWVDGRPATPPPARSPGCSPGCPPTSPADTSREPASGSPAVEPQSPRSRVEADT